MKKIFVSHSSMDKDVVDSFVSNILRLGMNIEMDYIFCSSSEGMSIKSGEDWRGKIKHEMLEASVILLLVSPNYKASEICLNEMGASWIVGANVIPLIMGSVTYSSVGVIVEPKQIEKIDEDGLNHLCDRLKEIFPEIEGRFNVSVWDSKKRKFLSEMEELLKKNPFPHIFSQSEITEEISKKKKLQEDYDILLKEKEHLQVEIEQLKQCKDASEVEKIIQEYEPTDIVDRFETILLETKTKLCAVPAVVRTLVFNDFNNQHLSIMGYIRELSEAEAKHLIEERNGNYIPVYEKRSMCDIREMLRKLNDFLEEVTPQERYILENQYNSLDVSDLEFWTQVIGISVPYNI